MHAILSRQHELINLKLLLGFRAAVVFSQSLEQATRELSDVSIWTMHSGRQLLVITHHHSELWVASN